ncbi:hypothetical protein J53TS2_10430 [Paenibacillus sp. J53TS2]|uniref:S-layer homology domain-containing protein n=1 Tax=Paenibacillus sp. J53TS2 TaxID=2807197 RepID=UPI001B272263|nr:S-layer homology domain-containing protein [Paenibacillus sp. J53TS2]GIP47452.1 hypothetical protein J53TS2_10430 [Paenibacillus sp. J53TS2]
MQRFRKPFLWLALLSLIVTLIPVGLTSTAYAATTYFAPDDRDILKTANYELNAIGNDANLRTKVKVTNSPTITVSGAYSKVSGDTLNAQVDLLAWDNAKATWVVDKVHTAPGIVAKDPANENRFIASNLTLFPGLNRITFKGTFGNVEGSETFFVLYDKIPYYSNLAISGSGFLSDISLNEGTRVVVKSPQISLVGQVFNTTKATVTIDGKELSTDIYNNQLSTPALKLSPGLNKLTIKFTNGSDSIEIARDVYYFTDTNPFIDLHIVDQNNSPKAYDLLKSIPSLRDGTEDNDIIVQVMVPFSAGDKEFKDDYEVSVDDTVVAAANIKMLAPNLYDTAGNFVIPTGTAEEVIIEDSTGPVYRLVTFQITGVPTQKEADGTTTKATQAPKIDVKYGKSVTTDTPPVTKWAFSTSYTPVYRVSDKTTIKSIKYLPDYVAGDAGKLDNRTQLPLGTVDKGDFYILVETDGGIATTDALTGKYLPLGTKNLTISTPGVQATLGGTNVANTFIYQVTGFATGSQTVRFEYTGKSNPFDATISYSSVSGILVDNLVDGQTYYFNSKNSGTGKTDFVVSGEYFGFKASSDAEITTLNPEYFVNGINVGKLTTAEQANFGKDTTLVQKGVLGKAEFPKFDLSLYISASGPLVAGENTIEFRGQYIDAAGNRVPVSKKLRIYIVDENVATITQFHPGKVPQTSVTGDIRAPFPAQDDFLLPTSTTVKDAVEEAVGKITQIPTEFTPKDNGTYTTSELSYDMVIRGSGASKVNLYLGSQSIFSLVVPKSPDKFTATNGYYPADTKKYYYEVVGNSNDFLLRIMNNVQTDASGNVTYLGDFQFEKDTTGTHVYNLELINETGARTNQRVEVTREAAPYRLLAPQPTVGDQYVVNKNFVRFDIEAEGATKVIIGKEEATRRTEPDKQNRFVYDYVGLKPDKANTIKIQIVRGNDTIDDSISVYYTSQVTTDTQFMAEKTATKYSVFNKQLELSFPKGTIMRSATAAGNTVAKFYPDTKLLFGIADPKDGVVERRNDYGIYFNNNTEINGNNNLLDSLKSNFTSTVDTFNFTRISNIYWISGGVGELGDKGTTGYKSATNGLAPYSVEGFFTKFEPERKVVPSQRGTLELTYDSNVVDDAGTLVTVFKYTEVDGVGRWTRVPGEVDTKSHTVSVPFDEFGYYAVYKLNRSFTDITNHPWARNILNGLYSKGIMEYLRSDAFGADDLTTRGEFATLLVKGLSLPLVPDDQKQTFFDVPYGAKTTTWDYRHLETAARAGIITGRTEGFFSPNMTITRQDAAVMIARALKLKLALNDQKLKDSMAKSFLDAGRIDYYALPAVQAVTKAKIMSGSPVTLPGAKKASYNFNPTSEMTRAEAGKIAVELLKKSTSIFPKTFS